MKATDAPSSLTLLRFNISAPISVPTVPETYAKAGEVGVVRIIATPTANMGGIIIGTVMPIPGIVLDNK